MSFIVQEGPWTPGFRISMASPFENLFDSGHRPAQYHYIHEPIPVSGIKKHHRSY